jgi:hypothetical protein
VLPVYGQLLDLPRGLGIELLKVALEVRLHFFVFLHDLFLQIHLLLIVLHRLDMRSYLVLPVAVLEAVPFDLLHALLIKRLEKRSRILDWIVWNRRQSKFPLAHLAPPILTVGRSMHRTPRRSQRGPSLRRLAHFDEDLGECLLENVIV